MIDEYLHKMARLTSNVGTDSSDQEKLDVKHLTKFYEDKILYIDPTFLDA